MPKPTRAAFPVDGEVDGEVDAAPDSPLAHSVGFLIRLVQLQIFDEFHRNFAGLGITPAGFTMLTLITARPGIRPGALAEELRVKPSNVAALVNHLAGAGLVERRTDSTELRASRLHATAAGTELWREMERAHRSVNERFLRPLDGDERAQFMRMLRKLVQGSGR